MPVTDEIGRTSWPAATQSLSVRRCQRRVDLRLALAKAAQALRVSKKSQREID